MCIYHYIVACMGQSQTKTLQNNDYGQNGSQKAPKSTWENK